MVKRNENEVMESASLTVGADGSTMDFEGMDFGIEGGNLSLSQIPILKLVQAMTPEATSREFKEISAGMFMNDVTKEAMGEEQTIRILRAWRCRAKFAPKDGGNTNIECSCPTYMSPEGDEGSEYGKCKTCMFNNFDVADHCQTQYHMIVAIGDDPNNLYRIILAKSQYSLGRKLDNALRAVGSRFPRKPVYYFKVKVSVDEKVATKHNSKYFIYKFDVLAPNANEPLLPAEVEEEFLDKFREVSAIREDSIKAHKTRIMERGASADTVESPDASTMFTSDALNAMTESVTDGSSEEIPF